MDRTGKKVIVIIAGPNGAGKTSVAREFLPNEAGLLTFLNVDLIAVGLSPFAPDLAAIRAGRLMLEEIKEHVRRGESFAFETTLSGLLYMRLIPEWQQQGYFVKLFYATLRSADLAVERVAARVALGGHNIPEDVIRRRFAASWRNFNERYKLLVDSWVLYDNSGDKAVLIDQGGKQ